MSDSEDSTDPPSLDYVPGLEEPKQAPPSPIYVPFIPKPVYPEFLPRDDDLTAEDDEGATDDDDDDDDAEEEEHLAPADPAVVAYSADQDPYLAYRVTARMSIRPQAPAPFLSEEVAERLLALPTPPPSPLSPYSSPLPQIPSPPLPIPSPPPNSPTYVEGSLGSRAAGIRQRDALPSPVHETEMPEICLPASSERPVSVLPWSWIQEDDILNSQLDDARPMTSSYIRAPIRWILAISVRSEGILHRTYGVLLSSSRSRRLQASIP
ncbi:hypothetical protein Tco_0184798 [Tanacetum coccineum]